jgi:hypothetical protein
LHQFHGINAQSAHEPFLYRCDATFRQSHSLNDELCDCIAKTCVCKNAVQLARRQMSVQPNFAELAGAPPNEWITYVDAVKQHHAWSWS